VVIDLDNVSAYRRLDPSNMMTRIAEMPMQCRRSWASVSALPLPDNYREIDKVLILGMGGSAIGGDLTGSLAAESSNTLIIVHRGYDLPLWVDEKTLVIASSYSGNTEETISAFSQSLSTKAKKLAITTGGRLQELAIENAIPIYMFSYRSEPRAAFGYSFFTILAFLNTLGIIDLIPEMVDDAIATLGNLCTEWGPDIPTESNPAKEMAIDLYSTFVVIYGTGIFAKVANRWKTQLNECSKTWAHSESLPELNHNEVVGYRFPRWLSNKTSVVMLRPDEIHHQLKLRYDITQELIEKAGMKCLIVDCSGKSRLSRLMNAVLFGDYVSYYLAILNRVDPSPVEEIDYLKHRLSSYNGSA